MAKGDSAKKALGGAKKNKLHTHSVKYSRADNGGLHAHVERHTSEGHHHDEHHVLASPDDAAEHLAEHLGDQPAAGQLAPPQEVPEAPNDGGGAGAAPSAGAAPPSM